MARVLNLGTYYYGSNITLALLVILNVVIMVIMAEEQDQRMRLSSAGSEQYVLVQHIGYSAEVLAEYLKHNDIDTALLVERQQNLKHLLTQLKDINQTLLTGKIGIFFNNKDIIERYYNEEPYQLLKHYKHFISQTESLIVANIDQLSDSAAIAADVALQIARTSTFIIGSNALMQELSDLSYRQVKNLKYTQIILAGTTLLILLAETLFVFRPLNKKIHSEHRKLINSREQLKHSSLNDSLTKLGNRRRFDIDIENAISDYEISERSFTLLMADLDRFKLINDNYGHQAGDQILIAVAKRITSCVRQSDVVVRLGGDEFAVILQNLNDKGHIANIVQKISAEVTQPVVYDNIAHTIGISIGTATFPLDGNSKEALIQYADENMYEIKKEHHLQEEAAE